MAGIDIWLTIWGLGAFAALGIFGVLYPTWLGWRWADVVYYPLSAVAVALILYGSQDINRDLERALKQKAHQEAEWRRRPNVPPGVPIPAMSREALASKYQWLDVEVRLGEACRYMSSEECLAAARHADEIKSAYRNWRLPEPDAVVTELAVAEDHFCDRGERLIKALGETLDFGAYAELTAALQDYSGTHDEQQSLAAMRRGISDRRAKFLSLIEPKNRDFAAALGAAEARFAERLLTVYAFCHVRPPGRRAAVTREVHFQVAEWERHTEEAKANANVARARAENRPTEWQRFSSQFRISFWTFVLVGALALKFGKALAVLYEREDEMAT